MIEWVKLFDALAFGFYCYLTGRYTSPSSPVGPTKEGKQ